MAGFYEKRQAIKEKGFDHARLSEAQRQAYPTIASLLEGTRDAKGETIIPPFSLSIFPGEGECRFVFSNRETEEAWFGSAGSDELILTAIEDALQEGRVEARRDKKSKGKPVF